MTTPTPRTDAEALWPSSDDSPDKFCIEGGYCSIEHARQLERDLAAARKELAQFREDRTVLVDVCKEWQDRAERAEARVEECERIITAMTQWLDQQQPDVFRRGLWDAIAEGKK